MSYTPTLKDQLYVTPVSNSKLAPIQQPVTIGSITSQLSSNTGTFTANGASAVTVANAAVTANSIITFTLKTVGGTVGAYPAIQTITVGTGFTVAATASDTSVYNYEIRG